MSDGGETALKLAPGDDRAIALVAAIQEGDIARLRSMLEDDGQVATCRIVDGKRTARTLLHVVADWPGHFPNGATTVATLAAAGSHVDAAVRHASSDGPAETPLHWAASSNDVAVLDALLDAGADIEAPGAVFTGGTPMSDAVIFAQWDAARRLLERGARTTIWQAAALGAAESLRQHLERSPPPGELSNALWHACRAGQLEAAVLLIERGANPRWMGHDRKTPIDIARESGHPELVDWLGRHDETAAGDSVPR